MQGMETACGKLSGDVQEELDRRLFHIRTLYDISRELLGLTDIQAILKNFLLMTMGNFGALQGFVLTQDTVTRQISHFEHLGFREEDHLLLEEVGGRLLAKSDPEGVITLEDVLDDFISPTAHVVCLLAFKVDAQCSGLMGLGPKLVGTQYTDDDKELLATLVNNLVASLKSARYSEALENALEEVRALNSAKDKVINHLAHELLTPIGIIGGCLAQLERRLRDLPEETSGKTLTRAKRAVRRLSEIEFEVADIMAGKSNRTRQFMSSLLDQCADEIELLFVEEAGESPMVEKIRQRIDELFGPKDGEPVEVHLDRFVADRIEELRPFSARRGIDLITQAEATRPIQIPIETLDKVLKGLIRNAIENTPDEGRIEVRAVSKGDHVEMSVKDYGVGITKQDQARIFEGFYHTQDTMSYSSKKPFEFNAGGRGADLLRMKIFSERYNFRLTMSSARCKFIAGGDNTCPGRISECAFCKSQEDCYNSGGTTFEVLFPPPGDASA
jgi:signal transduction histidine kinase